VSRLAQAAGEAALSDPAYYDGVIARIRSTRDRFVQGLKGTRGWFTYPSQANFIFTEPKDRHRAAGPRPALPQQPLDRLVPAHQRRHGRRDARPQPTTRLMAKVSPSGRVAT